MLWSTQLRNFAWHRPFKILHFLIFSLAAIVNVRLIHLSHLHEFTFLKFIASKWMLLPNWVDKSGCRWFCSIHSVEVWDRRQERALKKRKKKQLNVIEKCEPIWAERMHKFSAPFQFGVHFERIQKLQFWIQNQEK